MRSTGRFMTPGEGFESGETRMNRSKFLEGEERWNDKASRVPKRKIGLLDAKSPRNWRSGGQTQLEAKSNCKTCRANFTMRANRHGEGCKRIARNARRVG